ncbi:venom acid phosphatase Acph-1-like [Leptopilina heterotoma]|uniref:venom acid phosphatase Acph-1-like n=1 Tax=Leptopilina heterotoma TaxID=63436 RepID=UPI001CA9C1BE|nr:venom acid phosphatase Acph-1-like [Leptopilina heterotoma]
MKTIIFHHGLLLLLSMVVCTLSSRVDNKYDLPSDLELRMVNIVFRHGDRTPEKFYGETYPNDPYINETYYPIGYGALTEKGKKRAYLLGKFLCKRYKTFLGRKYYPHDVIARSTDVNRTKMTLQFVLNGLFPEHSIQQKWKPIPIIYDEKKNFLQMSTSCSKVQKMVSEIRKLPEVKELTNEFKPLWKNLSKFTGENITRSSEAHILYNTLISHQSMSLPLPQWANETLFSKKFIKSVSFSVLLRNYNETLKKMNGGRLLRKMTEDMIARKKGLLKRGKRINLYSAHDTNVAAHLLALGVTKPHQPYYTSTVILELYRDKEDNYYVQVVHYKGYSNNVKILKIPNCSSNIYGMCKFTKFLKLMKHVIPTDNELKCCDYDLENCSII